MEGLSTFTANGESEIDAVSVAVVIMPKMLSYVYKWAFHLYHVVRLDYEYLPD